MVGSFVAYLKTIAKGGADDVVTDVVEDDASAIVIINAVKLIMIMAIISKVRFLVALIVMIE